jgi:hypothetical protein
LIVADIVHAPAWLLSRCDVRAAKVNDRLMDIILRAA